MWQEDVIGGTVLADIGKAMSEKATPQIEAGGIDDGLQVVVRGDQLR